MLQTLQRRVIVVLQRMKSFVIFLTYFVTFFGSAVAKYGKDDWDIRIRSRVTTVSTFSWYSFRYSCMFCPAPDHWATEPDTLGSGWRASSEDRGQFRAVLTNLGCNHSRRCVQWTSSSCPIQTPIKTMVSSLILGCFRVLSNKARWT